MIDETRGTERETERETERDREKTVGTPHYWWVSVLKKGRFRTLREVSRSEKALNSSKFLFESASERDRKGPRKDCFYSIRSGLNQYPASC